MSDYIGYNNEFVKEMSDYLGIVIAYFSASNAVGNFKNMTDLMKRLAALEKLFKECEEREVGIICMTEFNRLVWDEDLETMLKLHVDAMKSVIELFESHGYHLVVNSLQSEGSVRSFSNAIFVRLDVLLEVSASGEIELSRFEGEISRVVRVPFIEIKGKRIYVIHLTLARKLNTAEFESWLEEVKQVLELASLGHVIIGDANALPENLRFLEENHPEDYARLSSLANIWEGTQPVTFMCMWHDKILKRFLSPDEKMSVYSTGQYPDGAEWVRLVSSLDWGFNVKNHKIIHTLMDWVDITLMSKEEYILMLRELVEGNESSLEFWQNMLSDHHLIFAEI